MIRPAALVALGLGLAASGAWAEVASVKSGEHPDFTRLVIETQGGAGDWRFGRTEDGYELALGPDITGFDLSAAFEKIPRDRVSGLWGDPQTGRLRMSLSCACHAIAFEFRPGIIVVDIKPGPPPEGTAFETALDPPATARPETAPPDTATPPTAAEPPPADPQIATPGPAGATGAPGYDWLAIRSETVPETIFDPAGGLSDPAEDAALDPLRRALLEQISRGVAEGVVEMAEPSDLPDAGGKNRLEKDGLRISLGDLPGFEAATVRAAEKALAADGRACLTDDDLDIVSWALPGPAAEQLGPGRSGMFAEFDEPVRPAVLRAVRAYVSLGFGAEARQFLGLLQGADDDETAVLRALTHLVDLEAIDEGPFTGQESCDTSAALWATLGIALADPSGQTAGTAMNQAAISRSFSALPVHLRRHLGPVLVQYFLARGDEETARLMRDATIRAPGEAGHEVELMDANYQLATGKESEAGALADAVIEDNGPGQAEAAITRVEAALRDDHAIPPGLPQDLEAYRLDAKGTELAVRLTRALVIAAALTGDFDTAFAELPGAEATEADLWSLAVDGAGDGIFLTEAVAAAANPPAVGAEVAQAVAMRLEELGFAQEALSWLGPLSAEAAPEIRLLAARAHLRQRDAILALTALEGLNDPEAEALRAEARLLMGDPAAAAAALDKAGDTEARDRALTWTKDWPMLSEAGPDPWNAAADLLTPQDGEPAAGPIARGTALVEESAAARATIEGLLAGLETPPAAAPAAP